MSTRRLEAFSDGVVAILITIMVLELDVPQGTDWASVRVVLPRLLMYVLSFVYLGIYWNNHHHLLLLAERINGRILWANLHLLFWLSLVPFGTAWVGENDFARLPTGGYGIILLAAAIAYYVLQLSIIREQGPDSTLRAALGSDFKGKISPVLNGAAIPLAFLNRWVAVGLYVFVAAMWLVPDRRIESQLT